MFPPGLGGLGLEGDQELRLAQRIRILELVAGLAVLIDMDGVGLANRGDELGAVVLLPPLSRVEDAELPVLVGVMAREDADDFLRAGDGAGVQGRRREPRVVAVESGLAGPVGKHLPEALYENLSAVVVFPPRVEDAAVGRHGRKVRVDLVVPQPPQVSPVAVAGVEVRDLGPEAIDGLHAPRGTENDVAGRQVRAFVIGVPEAEGELPHFAVGRGHLVEVVVVLAVGFLPREKDPLAVVRDVRVAET
jgi:hypothetical protein